VVRAGLSADEGNAGPVNCSLYIRTYGADDRLSITRGPERVLQPGDYHEFEWRIGETGGAPIAEIGVELCSTRRADGSLYLDYLTWDGEPNVVLTRPANGGSMWRRGWVNGVDQFNPRWAEPFKIVQNHGAGLLITGAREWSDYRVSAALTLHLVKAGGIAARVQGMRRYYALLLCEDGKARLVKVLDGDTVLAETDFPWKFGETHEFSLQVNKSTSEQVGCHLEAVIDGRRVFDIDDVDRPLSGGGVALVCEEGCLSCNAVTVQHPLLP